MVLLAATHSGLPSRQSRRVRLEAMDEHERGSIVGSCGGRVGFAPTPASAETPEKALENQFALGHRHALRWR